MGNPPSIDTKSEKPTFPFLPDGPPLGSSHASLAPERLAAGTLRSVGNEAVAYKDYYIDASFGGNNLLQVPPGKSAANFPYAGLPIAKCVQSMNPFLLIESPQGEVVTFNSEQIDLILQAKGSTRESGIVVLDKTADEKSQGKICIAGVSSWLQGLKVLLEKDSPDSLCKKLDAGHCEALKASVARGLMPKSEEEIEKEREDTARSFGLWGALYGAGISGVITGILWLSKRGKGGPPSFPSNPSARPPFDPHARRVRPYVRPSLPGSSQETPARPAGELAAAPAQGGSLAPNAGGSSASRSSGISLPAVDPQTARAASKGLAWTIIGGVGLYLLTLPFRLQAAALSIVVKPESSPEA